MSAGAVPCLPHMKEQQVIAFSKGLNGVAPITYESLEATQPGIPYSNTVLHSAISTIRSADIVYYSLSIASFSLLITVFVHSKV